MTSPQGFAMIPRWLVERSDISVNARLAFAIFSGRVRNEGIRLRQQEIADLLGVSWRTAHRALQELRDLGVLTWTKNSGDIDGVDYVLLIDRRGIEDTPDTSVTTPLTPATPPVTSDIPLMTPVSRLPYRGTKTPSLRSGGASTARRIDADFRVTPEMRAWAHDKGLTLDLDAETERFVDYWQSEGGQRARKIDWTGTWRNWMRRANDDKRSTPRRAPDVKESPWSRAEVIDYNTPSCPICPERRLHGHNRDGSVTFR